MPNNKNEMYRKILDSSDITANAVATLLMEKLGRELAKDQLKDLVTSTSALVKSKTNQLIDNLQKSDSGLP